MCGIAGFTHTSSHIDPAVLQAMTRSITHRGPDQQGCHWDATIALGAVRLKIIDLEGGEQPIHHPETRTTIVYNGEIYNHAEIRRDLELLGHRFQSHCDTEVALHAFIQWDTACFQRFRGMFALAIWSEAHQRLVLCRDRLGIKPLYIANVGSDIVFGSELKVLFEHPRITRNLNVTALQDFLSLNYVPCPNTLVEGISKLPPGHYLEWQSGRISQTRWWSTSFQPDQSLDAQTAAEELDRLLRDAVREHLISDVPLGLWASGGLDSSTLLHYASELNSTPVKTFSIAFEAKSCDESPYFREIAARYGTDHHEFELNPETALEPAIRELAFYSDEPGADAGALPVWFLSKMTRQHVTVALSGEGGDELFAGYLTYRADVLARTARLVPAPIRSGILSSAHAFLPVSNAKIGFEYKLKRWLEGSLMPPDEAHLFWNGSFSAEQKRQLLKGEPGRSLAHLFNSLPPGQPDASLNRYLSLDQNYYLPDDLLYKVDRMSMAHSLEVRPALLDHRIVEFASRLPEHLKMNRADQKVILKKVMKNKLPDSILNRRKSGLDIPAHEWFRGPLVPLLLETLNPETVAAAGLFDAGYIARLIRDHREKRINAGYQLWGLLTLFLWLKRWKLEIPSSHPPNTPNPAAFGAVN